MFDHVFLVRVSGQTKHSLIKNLCTLYPFHDKLFHYYQGGRSCVFTLKNMFPFIMRLGELCYTMDDDNELTI